jgi:anthranilate phosphoribosyltransferase
VVLINTAGALMSAGMADTFEAGIEMAARAIDEGRANEKLVKLVEFTRKASA